MVTKKELLKNVRNYSPQEIADAIRAGVVSLYELTKETEGAFTPLLKRQVKNILDNPVAPQAPQDVNVIETTSAPIASSTPLQVEPPVPVDAPLVPPVPPVPPIPVSEPSIPIVSLNEPITDDAEIDTGNFVQTETDYSPEKKPAMFSRLSSFSGRIRRLEFGLTCLIYSILYTAIQAFCYYSYYYFYDISKVQVYIYLVAQICMLWVLLAQGAKRCHDRGNSGWYQMIPFYILWMIFAEGDNKTNEYGVCPK